MNIVERLAVVETKVDLFAVSQKEMMEKLATIELDLTRYKGAWGMLTLLIGGLIAAVMLLRDWIAGLWR